MLASRTEIFAARAKIWNTYHVRLQRLSSLGKLLLPTIPANCTHNSHIYYIRVLDNEHFMRLAALSKERKIGIFTHYIPLHLSSGGKKYGRVCGSMVEAKACSDELYRLPIWVGLKDEEIDKVVTLVYEAMGVKE